MRCACSLQRYMHGNAARCSLYIAASCVARYPARPCPRTVACTCQHINAACGRVQMAKTQKNKATSGHLGLLKVGLHLCASSVHPFFLLLRHTARFHALHEFTNTGQAR